VTAPYHLQRDADLRPLNSFGVEARAPWLLEVFEPAALAQALDLEQIADLPLLPLGGGSNLLFAGDAPGVVLVLRAHEIRILGEDADGVRVHAQAGAVWHELVMWSLGQGLAGLENLALIPGSVGAAPIQNIGAYGVEAGERIACVHAWDRQARRQIVLGHGQCRFGYRDSVFKHEPERWIITAVEFVLQRKAATRLDYAGLAEELAQMQADGSDPRQVAEAVIRIRRRKLPDPAVTGNAGSFFKNPIVPTALAQSLRQAHPRLPVFATDDPDRCKIPAAWLIDACGWKGRRQGDAGVSADHALVLVNHGQASGRQLLALAQAIIQDVEQRFGVHLEPEPRIIGRPG
jgi:UDP-N-acetylmuramate dehydrogenase